MDTGYANRAATRTPVCFCLDISGSVSTNMDVLNSHVASLYKTIADNSNPMVAFDIAKVTFGGMIASKRHNVQMTNFSELTPNDTPPRFEADEKTLIGKAVSDSLELLEEYKRHIKNAKGITYYQPILIVITDGQANDEADKAELERVQRKIRMLAAEDKLIIIPIAIGRVNTDVMKKFSPDGKYFQSARINFTHIIKLLVATALQGESKLESSSIKRALETMRSASREDLK